jgi:NAD(P)-dependent dehydrogenase (short-subunit alcohol dehydrogenase family)
MSMVAGRVAVVTGAGRGLGREHALLLAREGAKIVVNDVGVTREGAPDSVDAAQQVVDEIVGRGGEAVAHTSDISTMDGAQSLVDQAVDQWGRLDVVVNNAGILRDRMLVSMTEDEWDSVIRVHLKGTFATSHFAANHWRAQVKDGKEVDGRIINTTSASGIYGQIGQANYGAAKAGIAAFTIITSRELKRYGVTVNAISPAALTRMTEDLDVARSPEAEQGQLDARWPAPICVWLASPLSADVTGRVFSTSGRFLAVAETWHRGPVGEAPAEPADVDAIIRPLIAVARPNSNTLGLDLDE